MSLTQKILLAMAAGIGAGVLLNLFGGLIEPVSGFLVDGVFYVVGQIFIRLLQLMVVPLVLVSLVCGVTSIGDFRTFGRVGSKTLGLYLLTTAIAIVLALTVGRILSPGRGFQLLDGVDFEPSEPPGVADVLIGMFPINPVQALAEGQMLQIIVFALILGFAINYAGEQGKRVSAIFADFNEVIMTMVLMIIKMAPVGVFALIARTFATEGLEVFVPLAGYFGAVVLALMLHLVLTYTTLLRVAQLRPGVFLAKMRAAMAFAFSTSSSSATIPVTLSTVEKRLGVRNSVASFTVPFGATINMDGTAIMQGVATVFIANVYAVDLSLGNYLAVILTATLASIGTAAVPGAGLIMLAMVLTQVGLPVEGIALIIGVDRLLDMLRTAVNITGDAAVTCVVARTENAIDMEVFDDPNVTVHQAAATEPAEMSR